MRIGLFGGTFNPVHYGHLAVAEAAWDGLALDRLIFIPSGHPPLKGDAGVALGHHRVEMLRLAVAGDMRFEVSDMETTRDGRSFTVDTVRALKNQFPRDTQIFFILGGDCVERLPDWKGIAELYDMVRFAVVARNGAKLLDEDERLLAVEMPPYGQSATAIRAAIAEGRPTNALTPAKVAHYIARNGLYHYPATHDDNVPAHV